MSDEDLKAELERLRNENAALRRGIFRHPHEGKRKGGGLDLWHGPLSRDLVQRTAAEATGHVSRHSTFIAANERN